MNDKYKHPKATWLAIALGILASIFVLACALPAEADAADAPLPAWLDVAHDPVRDISYSFKRGSCQLGTTTIACVERSANAKTHSSTFAMVGTTNEACRAGYGELVTLTLTGEVTMRNDAVHDGGTIAADEFDTLCLILIASSGTST